VLANARKNAILMSAAWFQVDNADQIESPALLIYPDRVDENIRRMLALAGNPDRIRPHVKTHKMSQIVAAQLAAGIQQFKCATLAEAQMTAACGAPDVLWAYQPVGPNLQRLQDLVSRFPATQFSVLVDNKDSLSQLERANICVGVFIDIDCGMHRTGVEPGPQAVALYRAVAKSRSLTVIGLHAYDGHVKEQNPTRRAEMVEASFAPVNALRRQLAASGLPPPQLLAGGSPTLAIHARHGDRQVSPGTTIFWDAAYRTKFPDLDFQNAAMVLTRVISKPRLDVLCLDLGYKAVAADHADPRVVFPELPDAKTLVHSEEHLAIQTEQAERFRVGDCLYGIPWHVCPTVAMYPEAIVVRDHRACQRWPVAARDRWIDVPRG
jgi:D-serine deaminase-like pyridoxal phosphate-dependent protein